MRKGLTEIVFVIDRSGSMGGLESDVIGGFNGVIQKQRDVDGQVLVSTVLFDHETEVLHDRVDIKDINPMTEKDYFVRGSTALLDAVGSAIHHIGTVHKYAREEDRPENVIFFINTDGMENSSHKYTYKKIKSMIGLEKEKFGWEFVFMGANIDAFDVAESIGISKNRSINYRSDRAGTSRLFEKIGEMACCVSCCIAPEERMERINSLVHEENEFFENNKD